MRLKNIHADVFIGILLDIACVYFYMLAGKFRVSESAMWPRACLIIVALLSTMLIFRGIRLTQQAAKNNGAVLTLSFQELPGVAGGVVMMILYALLMNLSGFFIATAIFMPVGMFMLGQRRWVVMLSVTVVMELFVYFLFVVQLKLRMP